MTGTDTVIDVRGIMERIPHRYPFLLIDRITQITRGSYIEALKNVTFNEPFFQGHFPGIPVMPGVLILEAMAQAGATLLAESAKEEMADKLFMFSGIDKVKFRAPVFPGDQLILKCSDIKNKLNIWKMSGTAEVDGAVKVQASLTAAVVDKNGI